ncbi:MAG: hypothetical protein ABIT10_12245 [Alteraurantiacibacter sp.]
MLQVYKFAFAARAVVVLLVAGTATAASADTWYSHTVYNDRELVITPLFSAPWDFTDEAHEGFRSYLDANSVLRNAPLICVGYTEQWEAEANRNSTINFYINQLGYSQFDVSYQGSQF